jgi:PKD repeat protein
VQNTSFKSGLLLVALTAITSFASAQQDVRTLVRTYLEQHARELNISEADVTDWEVTDQTTSKASGATHVHIAQRLNGLMVKNGTASVTLNREMKVVHVGNRLIAGLRASALSGPRPGITPARAVTFAAKAAGMEGTPGAMTEKEAGLRYLFHKGTLAKEHIPVGLIYWHSNGKTHLVWDVALLQKDGQHWWHLFIDAHTGQEIDRTDWMVSCHFPELAHAHGAQCAHAAPAAPAPEAAFLPPPAAGAYNVLALPLESPIHGSFTIEIDPANPVASPFGWHDTDGSAGHEFTITRGNNVYAYEDAANTDEPGFSPDGGNALIFDFPVNDFADPVAYRPAAITNLFYHNNMMHDIWYLYGFDEASGNFQQNNYGNDGLGDDFVLAEAQDGSGTNNANFGTPPDGGNPRMQMYLWSGGDLADYLTVNSPAGIQGAYGAAGATFGPGLPSTPITADVVLMQDDTEPAGNGCEGLTNAPDLAGKIALVDRGTCTFAIKVENAQNAGAVAVIIVNNSGGAPIQMGGTSAVVNIPSIMISQADGNSIKEQLALGTVNATISDAGEAVITFDSDFDNGIIAHEYGHGISNRLTGGGDNVDCLFNEEQMGEGWSDWFGLMLTIEEGDQGEDVRGIGTYVTGQSTTGSGIRPAPYSTDFSINPYTYGSVNDVNNISEPHGVGFIFATALWDLTWALIDQYGGTPNPDVFNGAGGNNIAMGLVIQGLKMQPCNPGMIDGRDAILAADELLYDGQHRCLIWQVFANRGFGFSADQGSSFSRSDQTEAFDIPPFCQMVTAPPVAAFTASDLTGCSPSVSFEDNSTDTPQAWAWDFGDGNTSTAMNPTHVYAAGGTYTVELEVTNTLGSSSTTQQITIALPASPVVSDMTVCAGASAELSATATGTPQWRDANGQVVHVGNPLVVQDVSTPQTFTVQNLVGDPSEQVGPQNNTFGTGGYHESGYHGAVNFTAQQQLEIVSVWVDASGAGPRTITVATGSNTDGVPPSGQQVVDQVTVNMVDGPQRVYLNLSVPGPGTYNLGGNNVNLYRNNADANYPYTAPGLISLTGSSAGPDNATLFYYYFYDLEVRGPQCVSAPVSVTVEPFAAAFSYIGSDQQVTFTDLSSGATSWLWDFGDGSTSTDQNPTHVYTSDGLYTVTLTVVNGISCTVSQTVNINVSAIGELSGLSSIDLHPNPTDGIATLQLVTQTSERVALQVLDILGQEVLSHDMGQVNGNATVSIDLSAQAPGLYFIRVLAGQETVVRKLMRH